MSNNNEDEKIENDYSMQVGNFEPIREQDTRISKEQFDKKMNQRMRSHAKILRREENNQE